MEADRVAEWERRASMTELGVRCHLRQDGEEINTEHSLAVLANSRFIPKPHPSISEWQSRWDFFYKSRNFLSGPEKQLSG